MDFITLTPDQKCVILFNINQPLEIPLPEFNNKWWPLVTNIWTTFNYKYHVNGDSWKTYICHFNKYKQSSTRKEGIPSEKCRKLIIWPANLCFAKIKVTQFVAEQKIWVERYHDSPDHTHILEDSERLKRSQAIRTLVENEAIKNYSSPEIVRVVKEYVTEKLDLDSSVKELRRTEIANIKYKTHRN